MHLTQKYLLLYVVFSLMWGYRKSRYINIASILRSRNEYVIMGQKHFTN